MTIHLRPELEELVKQDVQRGSYQSIDEYVERAVQMLHEEEELLAHEKDAIGEQITNGLAQLDRGEGLPGEVARAHAETQSNLAGRAAARMTSFILAPDAMRISSRFGPTCLPEPASKPPIESKSNSTTLSRP